MSLSVPITTAQMSGGVTGYAPTPTSAPSMSATSGVVGAGSGPAFSAAASAGNNSVSFGAAGWVLFGVILIYLLDKWGFRFAHVPI